MKAIYTVNDNKAQTDRPGILCVWVQLSYVCVRSALHSPRCYSTHFKFISFAWLIQIAQFNGAFLPWASSMRVQAWPHIGNHTTRLKVHYINKQTWFPKQWHSNLKMPHAHIHCKEPKGHRQQIYTSQRLLSEEENRTFNFSQDSYKIIESKHPQSVGTVYMRWICV